jgi:hypothetical protein
MDYKAVIDNFREEYNKIGEIFDLRRFDMLFVALAKQGFKADVVNAEFIDYISSTILAEECVEVKMIALKFIYEFATRLKMPDAQTSVTTPPPVVKQVQAVKPAPAPVVEPVIEVKKETPMVVVKNTTPMVSNATQIDYEKLLSTDHWDDKLLREEPMDDWQKMNPEEMLTLDAKDCAPMKTDEEFIRSLDAVWGEK